MSNRYLDFLIDPRFQRVNRILVLSFENDNYREVSYGYYLLKVGINDYKVMIDGRNFFDQPVKNNLIAYDKIEKIVTGHYFDKYYKMIAIDVSKTVT